jgi:hypothetical protein
MQRQKRKEIKALQGSELEFPSCVVWMTVQAKLLSTASRKKVEMSVGHLCFWGSD